MFAGSRKLLDMKNENGIKVELEQGVMTVHLRINDYLNSYETVAPVTFASL